LALGICSVSKKSCSNILRAGPGSAITIVVGGAAESLSAHPGTADLTLRKRLGFIKVAIQQGYITIYPFFIDCDRLIVIIFSGQTLCPCFPLVKMMLVLCVLSSILFILPVCRFGNKCRMSVERPSTSFKRSFRACSVLLYLCSMAEVF
jgi:hypothetical protein